MGATDYLRKHLRREQTAFACIYDFAGPLRDLQPVLLQIIIAQKRKLHLIFVSKAALLHLPFAQYALQDFLDGHVLEQLIGKEDIVDSLGGRSEIDGDSQQIPHRLGILALFTVKAAPCQFVQAAPPVQIGILSSKLRYLKPVPQQIIRVKQILSAVLRAGLRHQGSYLLDPGAGLHLPLKALGGFHLLLGDAP